MNEDTASMIELSPEELLAITGGHGHHHKKHCVITNTPHFCPNGKGGVFQCGATHHNSCAKN